MFNNNTDFQALSSESLFFSFHLGVNLGVKARHPLTNELVPVYVTNYVLAGYGSQAIMGN